MSVVVVGANGFLGRHLAADLITRKEKVFGVYHHRKELLPVGVNAVAATALAAIPEPVKTVYYAAGSFDQPFSEMYQSQIIYLNVVCRTFPKATLVYASSVAVYGEYSGIIKEDSPFNRPDNYGLAKLAGEYIVRQQLRHRIVRLAALYGAGVKPDLFIAAIIRDAKKKKLITLEGSGKRIRNFIHVQDAASLLTAAAGYPESGVYLGTGSQSYTLRQLSEMVASMVPGTKIVARGSDSSLPYKMDNSRTRRLLKWEENTGMRKGLEEMINS